MPLIGARNGESFGGGGLTGGYQPVNRINPIGLATWQAVYWADSTAWSNPGDAQLCSTWSDLSGNAYDLTAAGTQRPTFYKASSDVGGRAGLTFAAASSTRLQSASFGAALTQPYTLIVVGNTNGAVMQLIDGKTAGGRATIRSNTTNWICVAGGSNASAGTYGTTKHLFMGVFNGASTKMYIDGTAGSAASGGTNTYDGVTLGMTYAGANFLTGTIGFVGVYSGDFAAHANYALFKQWVSAFYGITVA